MTWTRAHPGTAATPRRAGPGARPIRRRREALVLLLAYGAYDLVRAAAPARHADALATGRTLLAVERALGLAWEVPLNAALGRHPLVETLGGAYYGSLHFVLTPAVLGWLAWRAPGRWWRARTALVAMTAVALVAYWVVPCAPPRLLGPPFVDTLAGLDGPVSALVNVDAALPSLHVAWATWCALAVGSVVRGRARPLLVLYPVTTTLVVLVTANHYLLDAVAGAALAVLAWAAAGRLPAGTGRGPSPAGRVPSPAARVPSRGAGQDGTRGREGRMPYGDDEVVGRLLAADTWAMVGLTANATRTAYSIASFLQSRGVRVVPVNPRAETVLDETGYRSLTDIPFEVDVVGIYRRAEAVGPFVDEAIAIEAGGVWMPLDVVDQQAAQRAEAAGLDVVMDRCPSIDWPSLGPQRV